MHVQITLSNGNKHTTKLSEEALPGGAAGASEGQGKVILGRGVSRERISKKCGAHAIVEPTILP